MFCFVLFFCFVVFFVLFCFFLSCFLFFLLFLFCFVFVNAKHCSDSMWLSNCSVVLCVALWFLIILPLFFLLRLHRSVQWMMGCAVLFQIHCTSSMPSAGRPLPPLSRACQTPPQWCEPDPYCALWPFTFHFTPPPALHLSQTSWRCFSVWSVCFCLIKGISPTVSCGDLIKNCILFLAILPVLLIAIVKRADKIGRMSPKIMQAWFNLAPPVQALHSTCANLTSKLWLWLQRLLHIINICILCVILYCFILYYLFKLRFSVFERRTEVYLLCWLAVWEAPDVAIEFKPPSASDGFKAVICEPCVHECVCAADAHWVGVAFVWWGQRFHCMWYTGGAAELVADTNAHVQHYTICYQICLYCGTAECDSVFLSVFNSLCSAVFKLVLSLMLWIKSHTILKHSFSCFFFY